MKEYENFILKRMDYEGSKSQIFNIAGLSKDPTAVMILEMLTRESSFS